MRSCPSHFGKNFIISLKSILMVFLLIALVGCSSGGNQIELETEIEQLKVENENLHTELDKVNADLQTAEARVKELEDGLEAEQESPDTKVDITPPDRTPSELLIGQWFYQGFHEDGLFSYTQTLVFNRDGTGTMSRRYYIPKSEVEAVKSSPSALPDLDSSVKSSWILNGDTVHIVLDNGETADFVYSSAQQQLQMKNGNDKYGKEIPASMEQYVERALYAENLQAKEAANLRRFLGTWYFDVFVWTFDEDGTGVLDIPKLGNQPASKREFSYTVSDDSSDSTYLCLILDWDDSRTSYFYPTFNADGSITFETIGGSDALLLTKAFDINNCPVSTAIIANQISVFTGSIFSEILPEY